MVTNKYVALKKIKLEVEEEGIPSTALREISYLRTLQFIKHPNIVHLDNIVIESNRLHLIFELVDGNLYYLFFITFIFFYYFYYFIFIFR